MFVVPFPSSSFGVSLHRVTLMVPAVKYLRLATVVADVVPLLLVKGEYPIHGGGPFSGTDPMITQRPFQNSSS